MYLSMNEGHINLIYILNTINKIYNYMLLEKTYFTFNSISYFLSKMVSPPTKLIHNILVVVTS